MTNSFTSENTLIADCPARIIQENIKYKHLRDTVLYLEYPYQFNFTDSGYMLFGV